MTLSDVLSVPGATPRVIPCMLPDNDDIFNLEVLHVIAQCKRDTTAMHVFNLELQMQEWVNGA